MIDTAFPGGIRTHRGMSDNLLEFGRTLYLQATTAGYLSLCFYLNLKHDDLDCSATTAGLTFTLIKF